MKTGNQEIAVPVPKLRRQVACEGAKLADVTMPQAPRLGPALPIWSCAIGCRRHATDPYHARGSVRHPLKQLSFAPVGESLDFWVQIPLALPDVASGRCMAENYIFSLSTSVVLLNIYRAYNPSPHSQTALVRGFTTLCSGHPFS